MNFLHLIKKYRSGISLSLLFLFCILSSIFQSETIPKMIRESSIVLDYFNNIFYKFNKNTNNIFNNYYNYKKVIQEKNNLLEKIQNYEKILFENNQLKKENKKLLRLLSFPNKLDYDIEKAEVIQNFNLWNQYLLINKGSKHGIKPNMPVLAIKYNSETNQPIYVVIGKSVHVNPEFTRVMTIHHNYSRLGVLIEKTNNWGILQGQNSKFKKLKIEFVSLSLIIEEGWNIVTSGGKLGIFPKGLLVGYTSKDVERLGSSLSIEFQPAIDLNRLDFVIVLKKKNKIQTPI